VTDRPKKLFIRFSNVDDHEKIMDFYRANPHDNVSDRHEELMKKMADHGSVILIETEKGDIVGASISYPLPSEKDPNKQQWLEIGTTRIVLNGYPGMFDVMIAMQTLRAYLVEPPDDKFVCQMESPLVRKMAYKLGFRPLQPSDELVRVSDKTVDATETCGYDNWYSAGPEALPVLAKLMRDVIDKPYIENPKTGDKITLDLSKSVFFKLFEPEIRDLAARDLGDPDKPNPAASISANRKEWMHKFFK
jgi:hypothetical protein